MEVNGTERDLHAFFSALYARLFEQPEAFGLSVAPDASIAEDEPKSKDKKQAGKRLMDRPRDQLPGERCNWCQDKKTLGPSIFKYQGNSRKICWYTNGDIHTIDGETVALIQEYEQMHAGLGNEL